MESPTAPSRFTIVPLWERTPFQEGHISGDISLTFPGSSKNYHINLKVCPSDKKYSSLTINSQLKGLKITAEQAAELFLKIQAFSILEDEKILIGSQHPIYLKPLKIVSLSPIIDPIPGSKYYLIFSCTESGSVKAEFKKIPDAPR
jgi:hypothetical protein